MIVHFDCPSSVAVEHIHTYKKIIKSLCSLGHSVTNVWAESTYTEMAESLLDQEDLRLLCTKTMDALMKADLVILDCSDRGVFGIGYQAATALQKGKPTLLLLREGGRQGSFLNGLEHPLLSRGYFNDDNVLSVIEDFLKEHI